MEKINLEEYRCPCGKLLFKGIVLKSFVEIKCKRCGEIISFGDLLKSEAPFSFFMSVDRKGVIKDICRGAEIILGYSRSDLVGKSITSLCPMVHDKIAEHNNKKPKKNQKQPKEEAYAISNNAFLVHDGTKLDTKTYCIAPHEEGRGLDYQIFSTFKQS
jgi:PAS domain S-box-containing protein